MFRELAAVLSVIGSFIVGVYAGMRLLTFALRVTDDEEFVEAVASSEERNVFVSLRPSDMTSDTDTDNGSNASEEATN